MWEIRGFLLFCILVAPQIQGQFTPTLYEARAYLTAIVDDLWVRIKDYGISNLPVLDAVMEYNVTSFGVELIGRVSFEDGFVQDIDSVSLSTSNFVTNMQAAQTTITGRVIFTNLRLFRDLRADLTTGIKVGTVIFTPATFTYELRISKQYDNDTVVPVLSLHSFGEPSWDIDPDDLMNNMIRRHSTVRTSVTQISGNLVQETALEWIELFTGFLNDIVETHKFPHLVF